VQSVDLFDCRVGPRHWSPTASATFSATALLTDGLSPGSEQAPEHAGDSGDDDSDGYTNIEEYLSCIVAEGDC
jgi:hypothetical protein